LRGQQQTSSDFTQFDVQSSGCWAGVLAPDALADNWNDDADNTKPVDEAESVIGSSSNPTSVGWGAGEPTGGRIGRVEVSCWFTSSGTR